MKKFVTNLSVIPFPPPGIRVVSSHKIFLSHFNLKKCLLLWLKYKYCTSVKQYFYKILSVLHQKNIKHVLNFKNFVLSGYPFAMYPPRETSRQNIVVDIDLSVPILAFMNNYETLIKVNLALISKSTPMTNNNN